MNFKELKLYLHHCVCIIVFLLPPLSDCFPIDRSQSIRPTSQQTIYTNIGETINISCVFDSNIFSNDIETDKNDVQSEFVQPSIPTYQFNYEIEDDTENFKKRRKKKHKSKRLSRNVKNQNFDNYEQNEKTEPFSIVNTYELDWYFLDKKGQLNIVSYGNQTRSRFKYKTFVNLESDNVDKSGKNDLPYSSSALYSSKSNFKSRSEQVVTKTVKNRYYLSVLIESDQDEGVYQCINPDMPNLILKNATVLLSRNDSHKNLFSLNMYIFVILINFLVFIYS